MRGESDTAREEDSGLKPDQLMNSFHRCFRGASFVAGRAAEEWEFLGDYEQMSFAEAFAAAVRQIEAAEEEPTTWNAVAANVNLAFQKALAEGSPGKEILSWDDVPPPERLVWECVIRHLVNLMLMDVKEDESPQQHEERIVEGWLRPKIEMAGLPEADRIAALDRARAEAEERERTEAAAAVIRLQKELERLQAKAGPKAMALARGSNHP